MATIEQYQEARVSIPLTILAGATTSALPIDCGCVPPAALHFPSNWVSCNLTFQVLEPLSTTSPNRGIQLSNAQLGTLTDDQGATLTIATVANQFLPLNPVFFNAIKWLNFTSSATQTSTNKIVQVVLMPLWQSAAHS